MRSHLWTALLPGGSSAAGPPTFAGDQLRVLARVPWARG